jgi:hypothetical protein
MKFDRPPLFTPDIPGPWAVDSTNSAWYVVHTVTLIGTRIGRIGQGKSGKINYFDRAMAEASARNRKETK